MRKLHIEKIREIDKPRYCIDLEIDFTRDVDAKNIKWETTIVDFDTIQQFYYDEGLDKREMLGPPHLDSSYDREWSVDFLEEVEEGYLEDIVKKYLIENLK